MSYYTDKYNIKVNKYNENEKVAMSSNEVKTKRKQSKDEKRAYNNRLIQIYFYDNNANTLTEEHLKPQDFELYDKNIVKIYGVYYNMKSMKIDNNERIVLVKSKYKA